MADKCISCKQTVRKRQQAIECDGCLKWNHRTCKTDISQPAYRKAVREGTDISWRCLACRDQPGSEVAECSPGLQGPSLWDPECSTILEQSMDIQASSESATSAPGSSSHAPSFSQSSDHAASSPHPLSSSPAVTEEEILSLLDGTLFSETCHQSLSASQFGDVKAGSSLGSVKTNNEPNGEDVGFTAVLEQSQESAPDAFDAPENEVSTGQDTLSVIMSQQQPSALLDKSAGSNHKELSQQLLVAAESKKKLEDTVKGLEGKLLFSEQEKLQLQKRNRSVVEESENITEALAKQREKYEQLQEQHKKEIEEIKKAVLDALAVTVEEFKVIFSGTYRPNFTNLDSTVESSDTVNEQNLEKERNKKRQRSEYKDLTEDEKQVKIRRQRRRQKEKERKKKTLIER